MEEDPALPSGADQSSSDDETVKGGRDDDHIAEILEEEIKSPTTPVPLGNGVASRYRQLLDSQPDAASDTESVDGVPRRAGSPIDSLLSIPDDLPSAQVRGTRETAYPQLTPGRVPSSRPQEAASSRHLPRGLAWAVQPRPSGPLTEDFKRGYLLPTSTLHGRRRRPSSRSTDEVRR